MFLRFLNPLRVFRSIRLRSLLERYRAEPGADLAMSIARLLVELKDYPGARRYLKDATRFPGSPELTALLSEVTRAASRKEIAELEVHYRRTPRAKELARLIELYRCLQDFGRCVELAEGAPAGLTDSWVVKLAAGKAYFHRFLKERSWDDATRSAEDLRRARALKPKSTQVLHYLGAILLATGPQEEADEVTAELCRLLPQDSRARKMRAYFETKAGYPDRWPSARAKEELLAPLERGPGGDVDAFLEELRRQPEVLGAFTFDGSGNLLRQHVTPNEQFSLEEHQDAVSVLARSLRTAAERMGLGRLESCVIEGQDWWIYFLESGGSELAVFADRSFRQDRFESIAGRHSLEVIQP